MRPHFPLALLVVLVGCSETGVRDREPDTVDPADTDVVVDPDPDLPIPTASAPLYANLSGDLYEVDPTQGDITHLGTFLDGGTEVTGMVDIAIDMDGRLFGGTFDALYRIDPETAEVTLICDWVGDPPFALAFTSAGELVAGAGRDIRIIDVETCRASDLVRNSEFDTSGDLVGLPDGYLYWSVRGEQGAPDELVRIDPNNGRQEWIGVIGFEKLFGMAYFDDRLYGFSDGGQMVRIMPDSADSLLLGQTNGKRWYGATTNPVLWD